MILEHFQKKETELGKHDLLKPETVKECKYVEILAQNVSLKHINGRY